MFLELNFVTYIRIFFGHCHVTFPYKEILFVFGQCHVAFTYMETLSFFGRFVQKRIVSCFSDSFVQKTTQQSDSNCNVTSDSQLLYKLFKKHPLYFCNYKWKKVMWVKNTVLLATMTRCASYLIADIKYSNRQH